MANHRQIKKRVNSIKNIGKITTALEMASASKVQRAEEAVRQSKPYADKVYELVQAVVTEKHSTLSLLRQPQKIKNSLYILITTNKGLIGKLNTNLLSTLEKQTESHSAACSFITLGSKGRFFALHAGKLLADFSSTEPFSKNIPAIIKLSVEAFKSETIDKVSLVYNEFQTILQQIPVIKELLPIPRTENNKPTRFTFEPSVDEVLERLLTFYLENQFRDAILEAEVSEHAARMITMKNASKNAKELSETLTLEYNRARQAMITTEILDVVTSVESLKEMNINI